jgi:hypothetical protein
MDANSVRPVVETVESRAQLIKVRITLECKSSIDLMTGNLAINEHISRPIQPVILVQVLKEPGQDHMPHDSLLLHCVLWVIVSVNTERILLSRLSADRRNNLIKGFDKIKWNFQNHQIKGRDTIKGNLQNLQNCYYHSEIWSFSGQNGV